MLELIHEQIKQPGPTGSIIHQRGCAGNITLFDTNQCAIPKILWSKCLICTMAKLRIEDEFCLLLLIKGSIQHAKVTCKAIPHKAIKKERESQFSLLKTVLWTSVHGTFQNKEERRCRTENKTHTWCLQGFRIVQKSTAESGRGAVTYLVGEAVVGKGEEGTAMVSYWGHVGNWSHPKATHNDFHKLP